MIGAAIKVIALPQYLQIRGRESEDHTEEREDGGDGGDAMMKQPHDRSESNKWGRINRVVISLCFWE